MPASTRTLLNPASEPARYHYGGLPAWLLSTIFHMVLVIILGLIQIGINPGNTLKLLYFATEPLPNAPLDTAGLADLNVELQSSGESFATVENATAPIESLESTELLASFNKDLGQGLSPGDGLASLVPGIGKGTVGDGPGGGGTTSLFGLVGEGGKFVYVFDRSASMLSTLSLYGDQQILTTITPLDAAKMEMARSLGELSKANEFQIVFYNHDVELFKPDHYAQKLYQATDEYKELANDYIRDMPGAGFTNHLLALETALDLDPEVVFLLTDGEAKDDLHLNVVRKIVKYCQRRKIVINVVHFCAAPRDDCTLVPLAEKTGGRHIFIRLDSLAATLVDPVAL